MLAWSLTATKKNRPRPPSRPQVLCFEDDEEEEEEKLDKKQTVHP
jgi:hypothetical protein